MNTAVQPRIIDEAKRRTQNIQKMLILRDPEQSGDAAATYRPIHSGPPPCRAALAHWPVSWREQWGLLANALEDSGLPWHEAEARAFVEVWNRKRVEAKRELAHASAEEAERN